MSKPRVLLLCTGNSARSQMAEAFLRHEAGDRFEVHSAGLEPRDIHPLTYRVMEEIGYDLGDHRAKNIDDNLGKVHFGYLITVCANAEKNCPLFPGVSVREYWPLDDPVAYEGTEEERLAKFREVRDQIRARVRDWVAREGVEL